MKLLVALDTRFYRTPDGAVWTLAQNGAGFWERYLEVFDEVLVLARVRDIEASSSGWIRADSERVAFYGLPYYIGPWQYVRQWRRLKRETRRAVSLCDCAMLRVPGTIATLAWRESKRQKKRFSVEVCSDAWEALAPGTVKSVVRPLVRALGTVQLKKQCLEAFGASYVTEQTLQRRYPPGEKTVTAHYSSLEMDGGMFRCHIREPKRPLTILHVGTMETHYKAQDTLIQALRICLDRGCDVRLRLAGDGRCRPDFESLVRELKLEDKVTFLGMLHGLEQVAAHMDECDLFVLPSLVEGLPRALIEAMARSMPCIAAGVGGIPELLGPSELVEPGNPVALADKIEAVIADPQRMEEMARRNYLKSLEYAPEVLRRRRTEFYRSLRMNVHAVNKGEARYGT